MLLQTNNVSVICICYVDTHMLSSIDQMVISQGMDILHIYIFVQLFDHMKQVLHFNFLHHRFTTANINLSKERTHAFEEVSFLNFNSDLLEVEIVQNCFKIALCFRILY